MLRELRLLEDIATTNAPTREINIIPVNIVNFVGARSSCFGVNHV